MENRIGKKVAISSQPHYACVRDALMLVGWTYDEVNHFIELNPNIWLQAIQMPVKEGVDHIEMFLSSVEMQKAEDLSKTA